MFTGADIVVLIIAILIVVYLANPPADGGATLQINSLGFLVVLVIGAMFLISVL